MLSIWCFSDFQLSEGKKESLPIEFLTRTNQSMEIYNNITSKPYSYVIVDNKADTPSRKQVITEVFRNCVSYNITGVDNAVFIPKTVSIPKQVTKDIDLKEDSVGCYKTDIPKD